MPSAAERGLASNVPLESLAYDSKDQRERDDPASRMPQLSTHALPLFGSIDTRRSLPQLLIYDVSFRCVARDKPNSLSRHDGLRRARELPGALLWIRTFFS